jgi:nucleoside-diphosphate-sugar epimerase
VVVFASSSEVYGDPEVSPQNENYFGNVNPSGPRSVYDEGKRFGEAMCMAYVRKYGLDVRIVRIFNTYGERMQKDDGRVVSNFVNQALSGKPLTIYGDGNQTRSFCYISDMVDGLISAAETKNLKGEVINLGNPEEHKISELADLVKKMTRSESKIVHEELPFDDPKKRKPDISRAKKLLNFEPKVTLAEGLEKTIDYFKKI